jgi:hypothetical protein
MRNENEKGITASDLRESPDQICKKNPLQTPKTGKSDYFATFNHPARSMASRNFTGDCFKSKGAKTQSRLLPTTGSPA